MSKFGWSYPAGCSGPPDDDCGLPPEYEALFVALSECCLPQSLIDQIRACGVPDALLEALETWGIPQALLDRLEQYVCQLLAEAHQECPACLDRSAKELLEIQEGEED